MSSLSLSSALVRVTLAPGRLDDVTSPPEVVLPLTARVDVTGDCDAAD